MAWFRIIAFASRHVEMRLPLRVEQHIRVPIRQRWENILFHGFALAAQSRPMIRTLLVDDHAIVRTGFRALIEREVDMAIAGECASLAEADVVLDGGAVDVLVLDISLRGGSGLAAVPDLRARHPALRIVMLSMHEAPVYVSESLAKGADGYITKTAAPEELIAGIRAVHAGERYVSADVANVRLRPAKVDLLSARERDVFVAIARGRVPKQIAVELGVAIKTVYVHRASVLAKLGARTDHDIYRIALENGLVEA
jgi:DNA-binding NarL/FixJ family response regulator